MGKTAESSQRPAIRDAIASPKSAVVAGAHPGAVNILEAGGGYLDEGSGDRRVSATYRDPVDLIWLRTAELLGMKVARSDEVFASWDGDGGLTLSTPAGFDADDCVAQLVLHEICHALVEGPEAWTRPDWGLENTDERDLAREHAAQRVQGRLAAPHGLRLLLAPTTKWRPYYDALPHDPLEGPASDPAVPLARAAWRRACVPAWRDPLQRALVATRAVACAVKSFAGPSELWHQIEPGG